MSTYIANYDLRKPGRDYSSLINAIKSYPDWAHLLESHWGIVSNRSASEVRDHLAQFMDANDGLTVITATTPAAWRGLSDEISQWLKRNLQ